MSRSTAPKIFLRGWKELGEEAPTPTAVPYKQLHYKEERPVPKDVPKGHLVVYVGEKHKRFIIQVNFLQHPLFQGLLDQAQQEYGFSSNARLCIPCEEQTFISILHCIGAQQHKKVWLCC